jgi:hypothetical protein
MGNVLRRIQNNSGLIEAVEEIKQSGNWTVPAGCKSIDVFAVGGGGGSSVSIGGGGGGGYTSPVYNIPAVPGEMLTVTIGAGGASGADGNATDIKRGSSVLAGAPGGEYGEKRGHRYGGNGGSGGGGGSAHNYGGVGGSDGGDGQNGQFSPPSAASITLGGTGQGASTRCPFNGTLYAGGGGGMSEGYPAVAGGDGGGGSGGRYNSVSAGNGQANTGGGGGGPGGSGGSGIIILHYFKYETA